LFTDVAALDETLSAPSTGLVEDLAATTGDIVVLGAGGKMGPSLCAMSRRTLDAYPGGRNRDVVAVARWSDPGVRARLESVGVRTVTFDLTQDDYADLPDADNVVYMVGAKFGTSGAPGPLWYSNAVVPGLVAARYPKARISAFSTGNVYPFVTADSGGSTELDEVGPVGEYAMSCLGRERVLTHAATTRDTPVALIRLNYAVEPRYGVLADICLAVAEQRPLDVTTGKVNVVWQRYANEVALRSLRHAASEPFVLNLTGPEVLDVRELARAAGAALGIEPRLVGAEEGTALLNDASRCFELFGRPDVDAATLLDWQVEWVRRGLPMWSKPTKFGVRDGRF